MWKYITSTIRMDTSTPCFDGILNILNSFGIIISPKEIQEKWTSSIKDLTSFNLSGYNVVHLSYTLCVTHAEIGLVISFIKLYLSDENFKAFLNKYGSHDNLSEEYAQWQQINLFVTKTRGNLKGKLLYELNNILCRFLLGWHNHPDDRNSVIEKAKSELQEKKLRINLPLKMLTDPLKINLKEPSVIVSYSKSVVTIRISTENNNAFDFSLSPKLYFKLVRKGSINDIAKMLLRYDSVMCDNGQFWGLSSKVWELLKKDYNVEYEGFACPLNSNLDKFFSLFIDTDAIFGSQGNYLEAKLTSGVYVCNPPYIETLLQGNAKQIKETLDSCPNTTFFSLLPKWEDSPGIISLLESPYLRSRIDLEKGKHHIQNYLKEENIIGYFPGLFLVLSNNDELEIDKEALIEAFN
jgi:hypothetical protein